MWVYNLAEWVTDLWRSIILVMVERLRDDPTGGSWGALWNTASDLSQKITTIAATIAVIFWAISFFKYVESFHKIDMREALGWILRLALVITILNQCMLIMHAFLELAMGVMNTAIGGSMTASEIANTLQAPEELKNIQDTINNNGNIFDKLIGFFMSLPLSLLYFVLLLIVLCCGIIIMVTLFMRFFKLYIYTAVAPLPLSTFAGSSTTDVGKHFLKAWASVCFEIVVIALAVMIFIGSYSSIDSVLTVSGASGGEDAALASIEARESEAPGDLTPEEAITQVWPKAINWAIDVLIKSILLVSIIKGSDRIMEKIIGT